MAKSTRTAPATIRTKATTKRPAVVEDHPGEVVRRKPDDQRKETQLHIRVTDAQKESMTLAAAREGLELSAWVRSTLLRAAGALPT